MTAPLHVHVVRHGRVASHRGDVPVTHDGLLQAEAAGRRLADELREAEIVHFLHAPTHRTRETAAAIRRGMEISLVRSAAQVRLLPPAESWALRNPDVYVAGLRVEMVSTPEAMGEQIRESRLSPEQLAALPFLHGFWTSPDRIGYWVGHPNPPGEDAATVARRLLCFAASLLDLPCEQPRRCVFVTHSGPIRALLQRFLMHEDPGEPEWVESVDLVFAGRSQVTIRYRDRQAIVAL